jgi:hypothetical protein
MYKLLIVLLLLPVFVSAQKAAKWQVMLNKKNVTIVSSDEPGSFAIPSSYKGKLRLVYLGGKADTSSVRTVIIMDDERRELMSKRVLANNKSEFDISQIKAKTGKTFNIYSLSIPKDPSLAAVVRVKPVLLASVSWQ